MVITHYILEIHTALKPVIKFGIYIYIYMEKKRKMVSQNAHSINNLEKDFLKFSLPSLPYKGFTSWCLSSFSCFPSTPWLPWNLEAASVINRRWFHDRRQWEVHVLQQFKV
jgi:hypothetical protein